MTHARDALPQGIYERDLEWGSATPGAGPVWNHDELAEAYLLAGMDRRALLRVFMDMHDRLAVALSTQNHKLVRAAPDGVACVCGQYAEPDHGEPASELWRGHLIEAALATLRYVG